MQSSKQLFTSYIFFHNFYDFYKKLIDKTLLIRL